MNLLRRLIAWVCDLFAGRDCYEQEHFGETYDHVNRERSTLEGDARAYERRGSVLGPLRAGCEL